MLGDKILVAPLLTASDQRQIYLPEGTWKDVAKGETYIGPTTIEYSAPLGQVPYFELQD